MKQRQPTSDQDVAQDKEQEQESEQESSSEGGEQQEAGNSAAASQAAPAGMESEASGGTPALDASRGLLVFPRSLGNDRLLFVLSVVFVNALNFTSIISAPHSIRGTRLEILLDQTGQLHQTGPRKVQLNQIGALLLMDDG